MDKEGRKIGFTCSCFDLLHAGHILMLKDAKDQCDKLIVGLQTDPSVDRKEKNKPIQSLEERKIQLKAVKYIDEIPIEINAAIIFIVGEVSAIILYYL